MSTTFETTMQRIKMLASIGSVSQDYGAGYQRGLRRRHHGEQFGTDAEHELWMHLGLDGDHRTETGAGYRDGFAGRAPVVAATVG